jgi:hypothetical protein
MELLSSSSNHDGRDAPTQEQQQAPSSSSSSSSSSTNIRSAVMVFTAPLVQKLNQARLPPNYVGVRRIRPSSLSVKAKLLQEGQATTTKLKKYKSQVVFRVSTADGQERRMTRQEKKGLKLQIAMEKKKRKLESTTIDKGGGENKNKDQRDEHDDENEVDGESPFEKQTFVLTERDNDDDHYLQLPLNSAALEQEIADLRGERGGVPPVFLSPAMAIQAQGILPGTSRTSSENCHCSVMYDQELSERWAKEIKDSMIPAETTRCKEDMRPMAYQLMPETWSRMRPDGNQTIYDSRIQESVFATSDNTHTTTTHACTNGSGLPTVGNACDWAAGVCRSPTNMDVDSALVFEYLHQQTGFYVSCGAKFGSDFLVYDGPREERHAFAGMRVLSSNSTRTGASTSTSLPLPTAYSLAGYVRCLNTAGKLAILATIVRDDVTDDADANNREILYRIAFVDVALEKILSAPTHQKRARTRKRRDVAKNLAKK